MAEATEILDRDLSDLAPNDWAAAIAEMAEEHGMFQPLGPRHCASFVDLSNTLFVSFESMGAIRSQSPKALPFGFTAVNKLGWSHLCVMCDGDTWFRDAEVYGFFDQLVDDGFFDEFETVVFYGAGPCGYAAAAFSVAAPGATVLAIQPQATLDPAVTGWDERFTEMRRVSFTDRYGYAPEMIEAAAKVFVIFDPLVRLDAMHASLFRAPNTELLRLSHWGQGVQARLMEMSVLDKIVEQVGTGALTRSSFFKLARARRVNRGYLRGLLHVVDQTDRPQRAYWLCRNVCSRITAPHFRRRLDRIEAELDLTDTPASGTGG
jgi:hypothetical protein